MYIICKDLWYIWYNKPKKSWFVYRVWKTSVTEMTFWKIKKKLIPSLLSLNQMLQNNHVMNWIFQFNSNIFKIFRFKLSATRSMSYLMSCTFQQPYHYVSNLTNDIDLQLWMLDRRASPVRVSQNPRSAPLWPNAGVMRWEHWHLSKSYNLLLVYCID